MKRLSRTGTFLGISDEFFVLTTSRQIAESFHKGPSGSWLFVGYNLGYSMALPIYGRLYEVLGQRKTFLLAYAFYGLGCIVSYANEFSHYLAGQYLMRTEVLHMNSMRSSPAGS